MPDESGPGGFLPEGLGQSPLEDLGTDRRRPCAVHGRDDIFQLAQILLPDASAAVVDAGPLGVIVVGMPVDAFGFQAFHGDLPDDEGGKLRAYE
jgi:hypothetical protein